MKLLRTHRFYRWAAAVLAGCALAIPSLYAAAGTAGNVVQVTTTVTASVDEGKRMPSINPEDVIVRQGKERVQVTKWVPAQGQRAGLELFILIDEASDARLGSHLADVKDFINRQPSSAAIGVGYMRNATVQIVQDLTLDHARAVRALRLPMGTPGAYGSPWLSVTSLMKSWPASDNRREIVVLTDGIDHAGRNWHPGWHGLHRNPDADTASAVAQRTGTIIHTIYVPGIGRWHRSHWTAVSGQSDMTRVSEKTGGESYYLGLGNPVSLSPYFNRLEKVLDHQYLLSFSATPGKKPGLQAVRLNTELAGVRLAAPDAVWVPDQDQARTQSTTGQ
ncbi:MAG TPA: hypothetical protein VHX13_10005 [Acidobacteriaceae bacterium]|jgi:hypothetical protein|nr:hypothetical protein [Acidobacteriaceae bacterium]